MQRVWWERVLLCETACVCCFGSPFSCRARHQGNTFQARPLIWQSTARANRPFINNNPCPSLQSPPERCSGSFYLAAIYSQGQQAPRRRVLPEAIFSRICQWPIHRLEPLAARSALHPHQRVSEVRCAGPPIKQLHLRLAAHKEAPGLQPSTPPRAVGARNSTASPPTAVPAGCRTSGAGPLALSGPHSDLFVKRKAVEMRNAGIRVQSI
ncbi:hypothetical protein BKA63DRAFT_319685 [Paraphoma chrysanthemicola]|nr:hypothetical protein BKA63DRAFT_319685 [Paraphoma chrysanthemicola]